MGGAGHVLAPVWANGVTAASTAEMVSVPLPVFDKVTIIALLVLPISTAPKLTAVGAMLRTPARTTKDVGSAAPPAPGSSVWAVDSLVPLPSLSKEIVPWLVTVVPPAVPALTVA